MPPINASMFISMFQPPYNPTLIYPSFQRLVIKMISSRIYSRGYAKHPCTQSACCQGFAVGPSQRYPFEGAAVIRILLIAFDDEFHSSRGGLQPRLTLISISKKETTLSRPPLPD